MNIHDPRELVVKEQYDVIVVGGGIGGIAAAVASARNGAKTLLMEKQINLGGLATVGLISWYEPLCDGNGNQVIFGICEDLIRLSVKYGMEDLPEIWGGEGRNPRRYQRFATHYSPTIFSLALDEYVRDNGVDIRFDTMATYPVVENDRICGIIAESVSGRELYPCKFVVDASGDASVCAAAGLPTENGLNYLVYVAHSYDRKGATEYAENGNDCAFRKWLWKGGSLSGDGHPAEYEPHTEYNSDLENDFIAWGKKTVFDEIKSQPKNERDIMTLPTMPQYRKIRHLVGETTFTAESTTCNDSIGTCGDFRRSGDVYQIPYSSLYSKKMTNLITAGRIISADGEGWEITRVIPVCALTGEAAGTAAALCTASECDFATLDVAVLQNKLKENGCMI